MATNHVGELIAAERIRRGWRFGDLARACGATTARQTSRIAQRLVLFERESVRDRALLQRVVVALDLDPVVVNELLRRQHDEELAEWNAWADEPVPMKVHIRPFAGFWYGQSLPDEIEGDELRAIEYVRAMTVGRQDMRVVLALSRRRSITFARGEMVGTTEAKPNVTVTPHVKIGGKSVVFEAADHGGEQR
ncbi:MAG TPA: hypothetical protein VF618_12285 [Thermoanaerobaculia bacterium]